MAKQTINIGTSENKGDGDPLRVAFDKVNDNFDELYNLSYTPANTTDWSGAAPTTIAAAIDRLAVVVKALNNDTGA
jgi:hypothetical protein